MSDLLMSDLFVETSLTPGGHIGPPLRLASDASRFYSVRKLFTGLAIAALMAWKLMVIRAIRQATIPTKTNTHQLILMR